MFPKWMRAADDSMEIVKLLDNIPKSSMRLPHMVDNIHMHLTIFISFIEH